MKIKGKKKLNKAVTAQLAPFGIVKAKLGTTYCYFPPTEKIEFKLTENEIEDIWFEEFVKERFGYETNYPFILSLMHEVGHHQTIDEINGNFYLFCLQEKDRIENEMENTENEAEAKKLEWQYFNLPDEIMATQWAVNYMRNNPKEIKKMWKKIQKALQNFYIKNNVTD